MSWGGGTEVVHGMVPTVEKLVEGYSDRVEIYKNLIFTLEGLDWGDKSECIDISSAFDEALEWCCPGILDFDDDDIDETSVLPLVMHYPGDS
jgi:hypothetical protein